MTLIIIQIILAVILFYGVNLIGKNAPASLNYHQLDTFLAIDEAPAFNYVLRVLTPTVYIILLSALFYSLKMDNLTVKIYRVAIYYVGIRAGYSIISNRILLINWPRQIFYYLSIIGLSILTYKKIIITKANVLPDPNNMANELWLVIIIFLYNFINNIHPSDNHVHRRKERYIKIQFAEINRKFSPVIKQVTDNVRLRQIALAIIIYESFNRPKIARWLEYIIHFINRKPHTLGIMQVSSSHFIDDQESVRLGTEKLKKDLDSLRAKYNNEIKSDYNKEYLENYYQTQLILQYNSEITYSSEVLSLADEINEKYFCNGPKDLFKTSITDSAYIKNKDESN